MEICLADRYHVIVQGESESDKESQRKGFSIKQDVARLGEGARLAEAEKHHTDVSEGGQILARVSS